MKKIILLLAGLALMGTACSDGTTEPAQPSNQLTGTVTDTQGQPVADAGILMLYELPTNMMRPSTSIGFDLPASTPVLLAIFNDGYQDTVRVLADGVLEPGHHELLWDGLDSAGLIVPSGVYYYILSMGDDLSDAAVAVMHSQYPADADPEDYHFLARTDADGRFVLEQGPRNFDYPFSQHDQEGNVIGTWNISRRVRFVAMAEGFATGFSDWAFANQDSGCAVSIEMSPVRR